MSDHERIRSQVALAAAGALTQDESLQVQRHLRECEICRKEFDTWAAYAGGLRQLPQPTIPADLLARTQARIFGGRATVAGHRWNAAMLVAFAVLSWAITFSMWMVIRMLAGGSLQILGTNLLDPGPWFLTTFVMTTVTAGLAALMLSSHRQTRRIL